MKFFRSYKLTKKTKYLAATALVAAYFLGFSAKVYSPVHIGHYAIPIPVLIRPTRSIEPTSSSTSGETGLVGANNQVVQAGLPLTFSHLGITTTYFWVGESAGSDNGGIANKASAWDGQWQTHFGGVDAPSPRSGYNPAGFTPKENPFYFALPYNDIDAQGHRKSTAVNCPLAVTKINYSWCKNSWIAIRYNGKVAYAQWEDVGPFGEDDPAYVFGTAVPKNSRDIKAGLDVSPAVKDYLGLSDVGTADWTFISGAAVPSGPWKAIVTSSNGDLVN
jgi:hypothetical protein